MIKMLMYVWLKKEKKVVLVYEQGNINPDWLNVEIVWKIEGFECQIFIKNTWISFKTNSKERWNTWHLDYKIKNTTHMIFFEQ